MNFIKFYSPGLFEGATLENVKVVDRSQNIPEQALQPETVVAEPVTETPAESATPVEVVPDTTPVGQVTPPVEPPTVKTEVAIPAAKSWEEVLKGEGFDDNDLNMLKHRKTTGSYKDYLEAMSVNYKDMSAEEIMRRDLRQQNPGLPPAVFERLYHKKITQGYDLDPDLAASPEDTELGQELLKQDAEKVRSKFLEKQAQFTIQDKDLKAEAIAAQESERLEQQRQVETFKNTLISDANIKGLLQNKVITLDAGNGLKFNYEVQNPQETLDLLLDQQKYADTMTTKDSQGNPIPNVAKMTLLALVAKDPEKVFNALINHGKSLGKQAFVSELENAGSSSTTAVVEPMTLGQAFLKNGVKKNW